ncbi:MAG: hypothetical protein AAF830_17030 [Pseudomonadota bacterium]
MPLVRLGLGVYGRAQFATLLLLTASEDKGPALMCKIRDDTYVRIGAGVAPT